MSTAEDRDAAPAVTQDGGEDNPAIADQQQIATETQAGSERQQAEKRKTSSAGTGGIAFPSVEVTDEARTGKETSKGSNEQAAANGRQDDITAKNQDDQSIKMDGTGTLAGSTATLAVPESASVLTSTGSLRSGKSDQTEIGREGSLASGQDSAPRRHFQAASSARLSELKRFTLYETRTRFYLVAYNTSQTAFRILKIDRVPDMRAQESSKAADATDGESIKSARPSGKETIGDAHPAEGARAAPSASMWNLNVTADRVDYTRTQKTELLDMIGEGNKSTGGLREVGKYFGIVGFIRFTSTYYMVLVSRRSVVGLLGGHYIYHCDETQIIPVCPPSVLITLGGRTKALEQEEARLLHCFKQVDLSKNFYFSYTYDLTRTLQDNLTFVTSADNTKEARQTSWRYTEKFVWNHHLLLPAFAASEHAGDGDPQHEWVLPLVHGFVDQAKLRVLNSTIQVTLIARRSRHFAGARFLKRGVDEKGHVANDVETEQIVSEALTTPFHAPGQMRTSLSAGRKQNGATDAEKDAKFGPNPRYTSYVMHRGSIPVYWTQDSTNMSPRPPIEISLVDPFYSSAALHFDDMLKRYGSPIIILNLIKSKEKQPREMKLLNAFTECVKYLNQFLPEDKKLKYIAWDMSRASKSNDQDVIGILEDIAEETIAATRFFHSGPEPAKFAFTQDKPDPILGGKYRDSILLQSGIARINCVDCLDRTNAAQFVLGKAAFGHQLYALGLLDSPGIPYDSDASDMLTEMYHDLGDTIALQYGGSHLVNTMETYRKINHWSSHSRDMLEGLKRYYSNSFVDAEKQAAINLFLGIDNEAPEFRPVPYDARRSYQSWYTPEHLQTHADVREYESRMQHVVNASADFWQEYYRPSLFTDLSRHHAFKMTAVHQQVALGHIQPDPYAIDSSISATMSASPQGSIISSPPTRHTRSRLTSLSGNPFSFQSETTISPFVSRMPELPAKEGHAGKAGSDVTSSSPRLKQRAALIGGVRRWMSLNRGEDDLSSQTVSTQHDTASTAQPASSLQKTAAGKSDKSKGSASTQPRSRSAWPTWEEVTGAPSTLPPTEALLSDLMAPSVSQEEAKEYASWLTQFREIVFESGPEHSVPEPAALLSASNVDHSAQSTVGTGSLLGAEATSELAKSISLTGGGSSLLQVTHRGGRPSGTGGIGAGTGMMGMRQPATQKQRQQVAEADALLYTAEVAVASGLMTTQLAAQSTALASSSMVGEDLGSEAKTTATAERGTNMAQRTAATASAAAPGSASLGKAQPAIEQAILNYPLTSGLLHAPPTETKVRAYTHWLAGHPDDYAMIAPTIGGVSS